MNKEEFKRYICDTIDTMDEDEIYEMSSVIDEGRKKLDTVEELIKINGEFKKMTKIIQNLEHKDTQNIDTVKPYIQMYNYIKDSQDILNSMTNANFLNLFKFNMNFGAYKIASGTINQLFESIMTQIHLEPIAYIGRKFNPQFHEVIETVNDETLEDETIIEVAEQGFKYKDKLINYAKIKVNKRKN